jgi:hypothetical protein
MAGRRVYLRRNEALGLLSVERLVARDAAAAPGRSKARGEANSATGCGRVGGKGSQKTNPIEVVLDRGRRVEVRPGFDAATLQALIVVLERV